MTKGFTLLEIIIAMGITAVAGVLLLVIIVNSLGLFTSQSSQVTEGLNINDTLSQMRNVIKQSTAVEASSSANQIVLKVSSIDSSNNVIDNTYDYFVFLLNKNALHFKVFPDPLSSRKGEDRIFATSVDNMYIQYFNSASPPQEVEPANAAKLKITLVLEQNTATTEANLRND